MTSVTTVDGREAADLLARRVRAQWLASRPGTTVAGIAAHTAGLQAQDAAAARLGVRARSRGLTATAVRRALRERTVVRTWLMRGTLHLVAAADVRWMLALFGPRNAAAGARRRAQLGLDDETCARALAAIPRVLGREAPLSRADLVDGLARRKVRIDPGGQAPAHLVMYAASHGLICRGPDLDGDTPGYVLLDEWVPAEPVPDQEAALAELTRRYLGAYGPACASDLAAWSGLPASTAKRGFATVEKDLVEVGHGTFALSGTDADGPAADEQPAGPSVVRLLGAFDTYLLGYRGRDLILPARYAKRIQAGGGIIHPSVLVDGRIAGAWRIRRDTRQPSVSVEPFGPLDPDVTAALADEAADVGRFLGLDLSLAVAGVDGVPTALTTQRKE
jgi:hypothetical protein